jgi:hypothetical protein
LITPKSGNVVHHHFTSSRPPPPSVRLVAPRDLKSTLLETLRKETSPSLPSRDLFNVDSSRSACLCHGISSAPSLLLSLRVLVSRDLVKAVSPSSGNSSSTGILLLRKLFWTSPHETSRKSTVLETSRRLKSPLLPRGPHPSLLTSLLSPLRRQLTSRVSTDFISLTGIILGRPESSSSRLQARNSTSSSVEISHCVIYLLSNKIDT